MTRFCPTCSAPVIRRAGETSQNFGNRRFCNRQCKGLSQTNDLASIVARSIPEPNSGCWLWTGAVNNTGYGIVSAGSGNKLVARVVFEWAVRPLAEGECVCHRCDTPSCINPAHLWAGTHQENMADKVEKGRAIAVPMPGEANPAAVLTEAAVRDIVRLGGSMLQRDIAAMFGVTRQTVGDILTGRRWSSITNIRRAA